MGIIATVFAAGSDAEAAEVFNRGTPAGLVCDISPLELWELEGILTGVPALEVPAAGFEPIAESDGYESFVIAVGSELGMVLGAADETGRAVAAAQWQEEVAELENWSPTRVRRLVEELTETLRSITAEGRAAYLFVSG